MGSPRALFCRGRTMVLVVHGPRIVRWSMVRVFPELLVVARALECEYALITRLRCVRVVCSW